MRYLPRDLASGYRHGVVRASPLALSLLLGSVCLPAQEILWQKVGTPGKEYFSGPVVPIGDRNGDGYDEFVGSGLLASSPHTPLVIVLSGKDGTPLRRMPRLGFRSLFPAGDMNGDAIRDYAVYWYYQSVSGLSYNVIEFRSGKDDRLIWQVQGRRGFYFGNPAVGDLDLDGDGKPDLLVSVPRDTPSPSFHAYANSGKLLYKRQGRVIYHLGKLGDVDGDRCDDYLVNGLGKDSRGEIDILSGKTGKLIRTVYGERSGDWIGSETQKGVGDVDGDGIPDFVASNKPFYGYPKPVQTVFSGKTGKVLHSFRGLGGPWLDGGDMDLDGVPDLLIGSGMTIVGTNTGGSIYWFSLRDFSLTHRFLPPGPPTYMTGMGWDFALGRRQKGNPFPVLLVSEPKYYLPYTYPLSASGRLTLYRLAPKGVGGFGSACQGTLALDPRIGLRNLGGKGVRLHLNQAPAKAPAFLLLGLSRSQWGGTTLPLPLGFIGLPGCRLNTSVDVIVSSLAGSTGISRGYAAVDISVPLAGTNPKVTVYGQWLVWDPTGNRPGAMTAALSWKH